MLKGRPPCGTAPFLFRESHLPLDFLFLHLSFFFFLTSLLSRKKPIMTRHSRMPRRSVAVPAATALIRGFPLDQDKVEFYSSLISKSN